MRAADLDPKLVKARYQLGVLHLMAGDLKRTKEEFAKLQQVDKDSYETRYLAAQIAVVEKQPEKAIEELQEAQKKQPDKGQPLVDIGHLLGGRDHSTVISAFKRIERELNSIPDTLSDVQHLERLLTKGSVA